MELRVHLKVLVYLIDEKHALINDIFIEFNWVRGSQVTSIMGYLENEKLVLIFMGAMQLLPL